MSRGTSAAHGPPAGLSLVLLLVVLEQKRRKAGLRPEQGLRLLQVGMIVDIGVAWQPERSPPSPRPVPARPGPAPGSERNRPPPLAKDSRRLRSTNWGDLLLPCRPE